VGHGAQNSGAVCVGARPARDSAPADAGSDEALRERLEALGYVR
jgi:hypothetical protein